MQSRDQLLQQQRCSDSQNTTRVITGYTKQQDQINSILKKYCYLLTDDPTAAMFVAKTPQITFK